MKKKKGVLPSISVQDWFYRQKKFLTTVYAQQTNCRAAAFTVAVIVRRLYGHDVSRLVGKAVWDTRLNKRWE